MLLSIISNRSKKQFFIFVSLRINFSKNNDKTSVFIDSLLREVQNFLSVKMSSSEYDIDMSPESAELLETARVQLRETPETRKAGFEKLRELLKENPDLNYRDDDQFLEVILRCTHWYPESAIALVSIKLNICQM